MLVYNLYSIDLPAKTEKCQIFLHIFLQLFELILDLCPIESSKRKKKIENTKECISCLIKTQNSTEQEQREK